MNSSAWDEITAALAAAPYPVSVVAADPERAAERLDRLGISANSWLGAVVLYTGGLLVDHGWLRVLGSGAEGLPDVLADAEPGGILVAHDVLGGQFSWIPTDDGPMIHYFAPDTLAWENLEVGYADWLESMLGGSLTGFYQELRWPGWIDEVAATAPDQGIHTVPPPWTVEGKDLGSASRKVISLDELVSFHHDMARQLGG